MLFFTVIQEETTGSGQLTVNYVDFNTKGRKYDGVNCDGCLFCYNPCDPIFHICSRYGHSIGIFTCNSDGIIQPTIGTENYPNTDLVSFSGNIGGVDNPVMYPTDDQFNVNYFSMYIFNGI